MMNKNRVDALCPECQQPIDLYTDLFVGQATTCLGCNAKLVVTWLFPISLDTWDLQEPNSVSHDIRPAEKTNHF